jgi:amino acid transporter
MSNQKKFGTFAGVFTPSLLTILGVIMYLRMGWVVGNAGLALTIGIIVLAHFISITTGLSVSSIATDKKVGAGGVYYVLSRSLGLPMGGALGIALFVATAFSIALYMVGFAEIFNQYIDYGTSYDPNGKIIHDINALRITGSLGLLGLTIVAFISTSIALKSQFVILGLIVLSLVAIFIGDTGSASTITLPGDFEKASFIEIFAIFFPAVTGFTAGIAMSGDLKDSKKSIPYGTMLSIGVGFLVYIGLALFLNFYFTDKALIENGQLLYQITIYGGIFVFLGVWGATLSSALGGILGGPRILQAMSVDKITPKFFEKGVGKGNEPQRALILTVLIAEAGILIGDLNIIAEIVSMFYLSAYGFINISFFLESWASADFNPTFKVNKWIGLVGFSATFIVMSQLNLPAMIAAFVIIGGIYFYLSKKQISLGTGDIWQSVWSTIVKKGLRKMESSENDHKRNWKPNLLLFSGGTERRSKLIEFSKSISGQAGIITNFDLIENTDAKILFPKNKQTVKDEELEKFGIFGRKIEVQNEFKGIESIASTFGFSGIEPNTTLMPWPGETKDPVWFTQMTQKLIDLDYNVLYLDYDKRWGFRKKEKIDLWWRSVGNNAELMLSLVKFIKTSADWARANTRILLVNDANIDNSVIEKRIQVVLEQFRIFCDIKIINNQEDKKPIYELMKIHSAEADLVFVGIPEIEEGLENQFVENTNTLVNTIGTTLLVKASSHFEETDLKIENINIKSKKQDLDKIDLLELTSCLNESLNLEIKSVDSDLDTITKQFIETTIQKIEDFHHNLISKNTKQLDDFLEAISNDTNFDSALKQVLKNINDNQLDACDYQLPLLYDIFNENLETFSTARDSIFMNSTDKIQISTQIDINGNHIDKKSRIKFKSVLERAWLNKGLINFNETLLEFGYQNFILLHQSKNVIHKAIWTFIEEAQKSDDIKTCALECKNQIDARLKEIDVNSQNLTEEFYKLSRNVDINLLNDLSGSLEKKTRNKAIQETFPLLKSKALKEVNQSITNFPHFWKRNTVLFSYHLQADLYLLRYSTKVDKITHDVIAINTKEHIDTVSASINNLETEINALEGIVQSQDTDSINAYYFNYNDDIYFNADIIISKLLDDIQTAIDALPEEVELMNADSLNSIRENQGHTVTTVKIQLDDVTDYITKANYIKPVQDQVSFHLEQLKRVMGLLLNTSFHINSNLETFAKSSKLVTLTKSIEYAKLEIAESKSLLKTVTSTFNSDLIRLKDALNTDLEINKIIEQYDSLHQNVALEQKNSKIGDRFKNLKKRLTNSVEKITEKVLQKKQDAVNLNYQDQFKNIQSKQGIYQDFIDTITINPQVSDQIPFYYQQLFTGKHINDSQTIANRKTELVKLETAKERINSGINAGILILGETLSGKTFLANHFVNHHLKGKVYRIKTPLNKSIDKTILTNAFQTATGQKDNINKILNKVEGKSVFLFENIEQWWLKTKDGALILDEISRLIEKFGSRHYFVLTANIHAYQALKPTTTLADNLISTVILNPLNAVDLINVLKSRHKLGGLNFVYKNTEEQFLSESKIDKFYSKFHMTSNGNIGLALRQWLANINESDENKIIMGKVTNHILPSFNDEIWKNLLYQFHIHKNLSRNELYDLYGTQNKAWINRSITAMLKAGLLKTVEKNTFEINPEVKPYLENSLYA